MVVHASHSSCVVGLDSCMREFRLKPRLDGNVDVFVHACDLEKYYVVELAQIWDYKVDGHSGCVRLNTLRVNVGYGSLDKYIVDLIVEEDCPLGLCSICGCWIDEENYCGSENVCSVCMHGLEF
jgi:hypothetical protein